MGSFDLSSWAPVFAAAILAAGLSFFISIIIEAFLSSQELKIKMGILSDKDALQSYDRLITGAGVLLICVLLFGYWFAITFNSPSTTISNPTNMSLNSDTSSNWALVLFTSILVLITAYYAWETRKIRKEAELTREIGKKPIFSFEIKDFPCSENSVVTQSLYLINYGPLARDIHIKTTIEKNGILSNERERYLIAMGTNQKIELLGNYCDLKRNRGKITTNITFKDVNMKSYDHEMPLIIDFNENFDNFLTIPYSIEANDRAAIIRALQNINQ